MNIFYTNPDPVLCALALDDSRVIKMTLESAQILCTATLYHGHKAPYMPTHANHPCTLWAKASSANFLWLQTHAQALAAEYSFRFGKQHATLRVINSLEPVGPSGEYASAPPNCTPYKHLPIFLAYKKTLTNKWLTGARPPKWTKTAPPDWFPHLPLTTNQIQEQTQP